MFYRYSCFIGTHARPSPYHDSNAPAASSFMMQIINTIIKEFLAGDDAPCQSVQDYSQSVQEYPQSVHDYQLDDVTSNDDAFGSYDELVIIFHGFDDTTVTESHHAVDEPRRERRRHRGSKGGNRIRHSEHNKRRHSRRNKQRRARRHQPY